MDGQDIEPSSVTATGDISTDYNISAGTSISSQGNITGRDFRSMDDVHYLSDKADSSAVAKVESTKATTNTPVGGIFMLDGKPRKATTAITIGEIINNSNSIVTTMNDKLDAVWDNVMRFRGTTTDAGMSTDYNDYTVPGYYYVDQNMTTNLPETGMNIGFLVVFASNYFTWQVSYNGFAAKIHYRHRNSTGAWTAWKQLG